MGEKKTNKKMSAGRAIRLKKMSARVSNLLYLKAKFIADAQGVTMEQKIAELLRKDIQYVSTQKWFVEYLQEEDIQDFNSFGFGSVVQGKKNNKIKVDDMPEDSDDVESGLSDFDSNNIFNKGGKNE